jgi:hypothetical protein
VLGDERLEFGHDLARPASAEVGLDPVLQHMQPKLLEPVRLAAEGVALEAGEGRTAPEGERLPEQP